MRRCGKGIWWYSFGGTRGEGSWYFSQWNFPVFAESVFATSIRIGSFWKEYFLVTSTSKKNLQNELWFEKGKRGQWRFI
jgi:hypothetical protein